MNKQNVILAYFVGVKPGSKAGHYCYVPGLLHASRNDASSPWPGVWSYPLGEGAVNTCWDKHEGQPEGAPRFAREDGWILIAMWDRSADRRGNCCAVFALQVERTDEEALTLAKHLFPRVFARIETHLGRAVESGKCEPDDEKKLDGQESTG